MIETWLNDSVNTAELGFLHHTVYRCHRSPDNSTCKVGGGVLIAVKKNIPSYQISLTNNKSEALFVHTKVKNTKIILGCCYLPNPSSIAVTYLTEVLNEILLKFNNINFILMGDFNMPNIKWTPQNGILLPLGKHSQQSKIFTTLMCDYHNMHQIVTIKNEKGNILDLGFTNFQPLTVLVQKSTDPLPLPIDKHQPPLELSFQYNNSKHLKNITCNLHITQTI